MSMLAERRRKTKWVVNPTKKPLWTTDSNGIKFGKELMEKMGWSAGKGLGAKEQGIQEPLRVSYKNDTKGMGFKGNDDDWIEQQDEFNVLLNQLWNSDDSSVVKVSEEEKNEIKSLEEKSRQSRARVHYQKFTRGKDLSRYSENDLACILGTNKMKKEKLKTEEVDKSEDKTDSHLVTSFGVTTINSGSIQDYFKRKWIGDRVQSKSVPDVEKEKEEFSCDERPSFSRVFAGSDEFSKKEHKENGALGGSEMNGDLGEKYEKRKKRKKKDMETNEEEEEEPKSKRKKTSDEDNPVDDRLQNTSVGVASNEIENLLGNENDSDSSKKRKKERRKLKKDEENDASEEVNLMEVKKKKKKKEKKEKPVENGDCDTEELTSFDCTLEAEHPQREGVKKKKKGKSENEVFGESMMESVEEPNLEVGMGETNEVVEGKDVMVGRGKKKKEKCKGCGGNAGVDEPGGKNEEFGKGSDFCDTVEVGIKKKKKKKEKQDKMECESNENGLCNEIPVEKCNNGSSSNGTGELVEIKKKRKKKEKQDEKMECCSNENELSSEISVEKGDGEKNSNSTTELEEIKKKRKKKEKQGDKVECESNESGLYNEIPVEKCDGGKNSNSTAELEEIKKKKKKKEKQDEKMECCSNENELSSEISVEKSDGEKNSNSTTELEEIKKKKRRKEKQDEKMECCSTENKISSDSMNNSNSTTELEEIKKKKKKKEKQDKMECDNNESGLSSEIAVERCVNGSNSNSTMELEEIKKKRKKKEKQEGEKVECHSNENEISSESMSNSNSTADLEVKKKKKKEKQDDKMECFINGNGICSEIPPENCDEGKNPNSTTELEEVKKKKKKDKHKTKEEDPNSNDMKESHFEQAHQAAVEDPQTETVERKKKKKDKKEKQKSKDESSVDHQEQESCPDHESTNAEVGTKRKERGKKPSESEGSKEEGGEKEKHTWGAGGNAEIGATAGIDKVELIAQRAAYEHVAGQHRYERVKKMMECVHLARFRGSNLECLDGYGNSLNRCEATAR